MMTVEAVLESEGFAPPFYVAGREAIANLFAPTKRCGIYVLHFADGLAYVGKSVDVTRRYVEHRRNHQDIEQISFKLVKPAELDRVERHTRDVLQAQGFALRGVVGVVQLPGHADFDLIMTPEAQERWLTNSGIMDYSGSRMVNSALRSTYTGRFRRLRNKRYFADVVAVLQRYVEIGIPRIRASEESFWSCSCLPKSNVYSRININWQEVLSAFEYEGEIIFSFHFARSHLENGNLMGEYFDQLGQIPFGVTVDEQEIVPYFVGIDDELADEILDTFDLTPPDALFETLARFLEAYPGMTIFGKGYDPGGADQINFSVQGCEQALAFLHEEDIIRAIRHFNLRLMRMGPSPYKSSHCLDLADLLVYQGAEPQQPA